MYLRSIALAGAVAAASLAVPVTSVQAATISGQLDIAGAVDLTASSFTPSGNVHMIGDGSVVLALGDFSTLSFGDSVALTDVDFTAPGPIWSVGGFSFAALSFSDFVNDTVNDDYGFQAHGTISGAGYNDTSGVMFFSSQSGQAQASFSATTIPSAVPVPAAGVLLLGALGGLGALKRRGKKA